MPIVAANYLAAKIYGIKRYWCSCPHHGRNIWKYTSNRSCVHCCKSEGDKYKKRNAKALLVSRREWSLKNPEKTIFQRAAFRARKSGLDFNITVEDIHIPHRCPVFGEILITGEKSDWNPSLDRIDNNKGYVKGNVIIVSHLANRLKSNATMEQLKRIVEFYEQTNGNNSTTFAQHVSTGQGALDPSPSDAALYPSRI